MGCSCCKEFRERREPLRPENAASGAARRRHGNNAATTARHDYIYTTARPAGTTGPSARAPPPPPDRCDICGSKIDPALLDSHRESCRMNHRRNMRSAADESRAAAAAAAHIPLPRSGSACAF